MANTLNTTFVDFPATHLETIDARCLTPTLTINKVYRINTELCELAANHGETTYVEPASFWIEPGDKEYFNYQMSKARRAARHAQSNYALAIIVIQEYAITVKAIGLTF